MEEFGCSVGFHKAVLSQLCGRYLQMERVERDREVRKQPDYVIAPKCSRERGFQREEDEVKIRKGKKTWAAWKLTDDREMKQFRLGVALEEGVRD